MTPCFPDICRVSYLKKERYGVCQYDPGKFLMSSIVSGSVAPFLGFMDPLLNPIFLLDGSHICFDMLKFLRMISILLRNK